VAIRNPVGTAPSFIVESGRNAVISLPGVPREMEYLLHEAVIPYLQNRYALNQIIKVRVLHTAGMGEGMIDEQIGDLEQFTNPTVGLAAHTGVVDVRIAAKAGTESEADAMIAGVEREVRSRLKAIVFGADDDTLEGVTLAAVARRGWTLAIVAYGLSESYLRRLPGAAVPADLQPGALPEALRRARSESAAQAALGIAAFLDGTAAEVMAITPRREKKHRLTYGGPPRSLARWAFHAGLNLLRVETEAAS
jgi:hypothetical protein